MKGLCRSDATFFLNSVYVVCIEVYLLISIIRYGLLLKTLVILPDMYDKYHFDRYFRSFSHFYTLYSGKNEELWNEYGARKITKDELNEQRFAYPLLQVGVADKAFGKSLFRIIFLMI